MKPASAPVLISTERLFKPKTKTSKKEVFVNNEDSVDVDFPASMSMNNDNPKEEVKKPSSPVKVSLFKNRGACHKAAGGRKRKKEKEVNYDSDSIDIDVLATFSAKSFANAAQTSPGAQVIDFCLHV